MLHYQLWSQVHLHLGHLITLFFSPAVKTNPALMKTLLALLPLEARITAFIYLLGRKSEISGTQVHPLGAALKELHQSFLHGTFSTAHAEKLKVCLAQLEERIWKIPDQVISNEL